VVAHNLPDARNPVRIHEVPSEVCPPEVAQFRTPARSMTPLSGGIPAQSGGRLASKQCQAIAR
jgi:hypothetical protein